MSKLLKEKNNVRLIQFNNTYDVVKFDNETEIFTYDNIMEAKDKFFELSSIYITDVIMEEFSKRMEHAYEAGMIDDYKSSASIASRILWEIAPEVAEMLPDGDCSPRAFSEAWDEVIVKP